MTEQTARAEDAADSPQGAASSAESAAAPEADAAALAADFKDKLLRTLAEMENLRKRTAREVNDARVYGVTSFARDMLAVADNMRRALDAVSPALRASAEAGVKSLIEGVELTERELLKALEKSGVRQFTPQGEKFDPNVHQAMFEVPNASVPAGKHRRGRTARLHDRGAHAAARHGRRIERRSEVATHVPLVQRQRYWLRRRRRTAAAEALLVTSARRCRVPFAAVPERWSIYRRRRLQSSA